MKRESLMTAELAVFHEHLFHPVHCWTDDYCKRVDAGFRRMKSDRVVIAGLARNIADVLPVTARHVEGLGELFADYRVVIYENDSNDGTREMLEAWSHANPKVTLLSEQKGDPVNRPERSLARAARMAYYRTQCQSHVEENFADFDYSILVDMDVAGGWSLDGVANTFGHDAWDFVGANGVIFRRRGLRPNELLHYDAWAYRTDRDFTPLSTKEVNRTLYHRGEPLVPVTSCFGGLGVYTMRSYLAGTYDGKDVEHVTFHRSLLAKGIDRFFLNPSQIVLYGRKTRRNDPVFATMLRWLDFGLRREQTVWHFPLVPRGKKGSVGSEGVAVMEMSTGKKGEAFSLAQPSPSSEGNRPSRRAA